MNKNLEYAVYDWTKNDCKWFDAGFKKELDSFVNEVKNRLIFQHTGLDPITEISGQFGFTAVFDTELMGWKFAIYHSGLDTIVLKVATRIPTLHHVLQKYFIG